MTDRPVGRRPGDPAETRSDILSAAQARFGEAGFDRATIRSIAELAGVDPALVLHHFGSKLDLFVAAHELPINPKHMVDMVLALPPPERARALTEAHLTMVLAPGAPLFSMLRTAATNDAAAKMVHEFVTSVFLSRADELAPGPDSRLRLALVGSQLVGVAFTRIIIGVAPLTEATIAELVDHVAPTIDGYLRGRDR